ncbi:GGDEF domain-containing protein [Solirubrobacter sp. CPCC 204708]|uniref:GGDEF domain-containing protein n=1 Tax=Solirubrobacter deserti TaxID=2282478 RepID=A0ABT4RT88_9ACTN|nr:GGDEF domain-containing protein [Solirubrobacter deserti]MBE2315919.1 GGDEF domain-containing protein [Solirubrobacter deserti]MDA0141598.1 GGDEF domain-containing protein [Solirubrobacter deserti]
MDARPTWLCPDLAARERLLDMDERLRRPRVAALGLLGACVLAALPYLGWRPLVLLLCAVLVVVVVGRVARRLPAPEYGLALSWAFSQIMIATAIATTGGIRSFVLSWLVVPLVTLPARFGARGVVAGVGFAGVLVAAIALLVPVSEPLPLWYATTAMLATLFSVAILLLALMRSDVDHRTEAVVDGLTGMLNRRALEHRLEELRAQAAVSGQSIAAIAADIDHFKRINDEHGHARGDAVLAEVAQRLRGGLRAFDLAYRLGGEEFLVLLPGADVREATALADELRASVGTAPIDELDVTVSFGVAATGGGAFNGAELLAAADAALYAAKAGGRDTVVTA